MGQTTNYTKVFLLVSLVSMSGPAAALVDVEVGAGSRAGKYSYENAANESKSKTVNGSEVFANVMVDPIPLIPISFGLAIQSYSLDTSKANKEMLDEGLGNAAALVDTTADVKTTGLLYGPSFKVWAPTPFVKPYLRFAYLMGTETQKGDMSIKSKDESASLTTDVKMVADHTGSDLQLGLDFAPSKFFGIFLEFALHTGKSKPKSVNQTIEMTQSGTTTSQTTTELTDDEKKARTANATSIRLGLSVGI